MLVSVIIATYNYAAFVETAILSALSLVWDAVEVIVVDDGSTDGSREILEKYRGRVTLIYQDNAGQVRANNRGFAASRGDLVIFLDADDELHADLVQRAICLVRAGVSKVQCQMARIDACGYPTGSLRPEYEIKPTAEKIRKWVTRAAQYPTPPGSGNIYARWFLEQLFPLDEEVWAFTDSCCLAAAPFVGDVETVCIPLVYYRIHGSNDSQMTEFSTLLPRRGLLLARQRFDYSREIALRYGIEVPEGALYRGLLFCSNRIVSFRYSPEMHPIEADSRWRIILDTLYAGITPQGYAFVQATIVVAWVISVAVLPSSWGRQLISWRFIPSSRPKLIIATAKWSRILRRVSERSRKK